jgi:hypothetical protein
MELNTKQRRLIWVGIVIIAIMGVFPPWTHTFKNHLTYSEVPAGYCFIASPPNKLIPSSIFSGVKVDMARLLVQLIGTMIILSLGLLATAKRKNDD